MSAVWLMAVIASTIFLLIGGNADFTVIFSDGAESAVSLIISLAGIMAVWGGIMEIAERSGITKVFAKVLQPIVLLLFPGIRSDGPSMRAIVMNITANVLGLGNAATPLGIEAMKRLKKVGGDSIVATDEMVTFVIINTASVQIIPATTAVLRARFGSEQPMVIMPAVLLASVSSLIVGLIADRLLRRKKNA